MKAIVRKEEISSEVCEVKVDDLLRAIDDALIFYTQGEREVYIPESLIDVIREKLSNTETEAILKEFHIARPKIDKPLPPTDQEIIGWDLIGRCPNCGATVNATMEHCDECNQRLDWGVNNDKN